MKTVDIDELVYLMIRFLNTMPYCSKSSSLNKASLLLILLTVALISVTLIMNIVNNCCEDKTQNVKKDTVPELLKPAKLETVARSGWQAQSPRHQSSLRTPVPYVIIQQTETGNCCSRAECIFKVRSIQEHHMEFKGWDDIGYNFLVGGDGKIYIGRGWDTRGAHTYGYNGLSIGIAFIGNFKALLPSENQLEACDSLIHEGVTLGYVQKNYKLFGARQLRMTDSPGDKLYEKIQTWPHWTDEYGSLEMTELKIISRSEWLAKLHRQLPTALNLPVPYVIITHTVTENCFTETECAKIVRKIQTYQMEGENWNDIAYNFLVGGDGNVYCGRGWENQGAHTKNYNELSIGIALIGYFQNSLPTEKQLDSLKKLLSQGVRSGFINKQYKLFGAKQFRNTESPGIKLFNEIKKWKHWAEKP